MIITPYMPEFCHLCQVLVKIRLSIDNEKIKQVNDRKQV